MMQSPKDPVQFLLVDDLEDNLLSLEALLRRDGLVIHRARSGPDALEILLNNEIGLALLDVQMPGMDGFELAELMRGTERTRRVPIIFVTAGTSDRRRRFRGYEAGAVDFLQKPIEPDILKSKAAVFFELDRQRRQLAQQRDEIKIQADENTRLLEESRTYAAVLKEMDRRKDEFLATLAHELRNPLAPIRNGLQILKAPANDKVASEVREIMEHQVTHLVRLIDDLLDVSRVSEGKINLRTQEITVQAAIESAIESSSHLIESCKHTLKVDMASEPLWLYADLTRMAQVISNILNNAAKYTPPGGEISISAHKIGDHVAIAVSDNGIGIPGDMQSEVFEMFTQVNNSLDRSQGGLGIGLSLARRLIEMHNGTINVRSAGDGKGSTFTITLPLMDSAKEMPQAVESPAMEPAENPLRVLVVDDNVSSAKTMGWMLEFAGHSTTLVHSGEEALEVARRQHPEVILLDIGMPGMNGYDVCRELRRDPKFETVVFIAQTGWGQERDRKRAIEAGFDHHLIKPVNFDQFSSLMAKIQKNMSEHAPPR